MYNYTDYEPQTTPKSSGSAVTFVVFMIAGLVAGCTVLGVWKQPWAELVKQLKVLTPAPSGPPAWSQRSLGDVRLEAPFDFGPGPDVAAQLPPQVRAALEYLEVFQSRGTPENFTVLVTRCAYKPRINPSLDGAVQGAMQNAAAVGGDLRPKYKSQHCTINGNEGRYVTYHRPSNGLGTPNVRIDATFAKRGQQLWQVLIVYGDNAKASEAARILKSFEIQ